jgi:hypothetical protein
VRWLSTRCGRCTPPRRRAAGGVLLRGAVRTSRPRCGAARRCAADDTPRPATRLRLVARASPRPHAALDGERASGVGGRELMSRASPQRSPAPALSNVPAPSITTPGSP